MYELTSEGQFAGKVYFGSNCSFIQAPGLVVRIDYIRHFLRSNEYHLIHHLTGEQIGYIDFYSSFSDTGGIANIHFATTAFLFRRNRSHVSWRNPSSWSLTRYDMSNTDLETSYFYRSNEVTRIECSKEEQWLEILTGLFVIGYIDKKAREAG